MTDVVVRQPLDEKINLAKYLAEASIIPESYRKQPANLLVALEMAEALNLHPMQAINGITVIKGKMSMSAELMRTLVLRAGHQIDVDVLTEQGCRLLVARRERPDNVQAFEFTMVDAQHAGLGGQENYRKHPKAMLLARCTSLACRAVFPDAIAGAGYTPDELADPRPAAQARPVVSTVHLAAAPARQPHPDVPGVEVDDDGVLWDDSGDAAAQGAEGE